MRVLFVQKMAGVSGSELYYLQILPALVEIGVHASFLVLEHPKDINLNDGFVAELERAGVEVIREHYGAELSPLLVRRIANVVRGGRYDVVQSNLIHADVWLAAAKLFHLPRMRLVSAKHGYAEAFQARFGLDPSRIRPDAMSIATRFAARQADRVLTISKALSNLLGGAGLVDPGKIVVIPYGFSFHPVESRLPAGEARYGSPQIVSIGRLVAYKQHGGLIGSFADIVSKHPSAKLVIVGGGPEEERLKSLADQLGVGNAVVFTGRSSNPHDYLRDSDMFVFPSTSEGFGAVILEAWYHALPVIAFDVPAPNEIVTDRVDGFLIEPFDWNHLGARMDELMASPELRKSLGERGRATLRTRYGIETMLSATVRLYEEVLAA